MIPLRISICLFFFAHFSIRSIRLWTITLNSLFLLLIRDRRSLNFLNFTLLFIRVMLRAELWYWPLFLQELFLFWSQIVYNGSFIILNHRSFMWRIAIAIKSCSKASFKILNWPFCARFSWLICIGLSFCSRRWCFSSCSYRRLIFLQRDFVWSGLRVWLRINNTISYRSLGLS